MIGLSGGDSSRSDTIAKSPGQNVKGMRVWVLFMIFSRKMLGQRN